MNKKSGFTLTELLILVIIPLFTVGWIWNIIKLFNVLDDPFSAKIVLRMLGIVLLPLGAIIGYF